MPKKLIHAIKRSLLWKLKKNLTFYCQEKRSDVVTYLIGVLVGVGAHDEKRHIQLYNCKQSIFSLKSNLRSASKAFAFSESQVLIGRLSGRSVASYHSL